MACLQPGEALEATGMILPVRLGEAALALEDIAPRLVNDAHAANDCRAVVAIIDKFESCAIEPTHVQSIPDAGGPIISIAGLEPTEAYIDSWLAKGTLLGEDGSYSVFVAFMDVMRRPFQGSWTAQTITILGTRQSVQSLLEELRLDEALA